MFGREKKKQRFTVKENHAVGMYSLSVICDTVTGVNYLAAGGDGLLSVLDVDVVHAHAAANDELKLTALGFINVASADFGGAANYYSVKLAQGGAQLLGGIETLHDLVSVGLQLVQGGFIHPVSNKDSHNNDVKYAEDAGITVKNTPRASSNSVAELALGHMFSCARFLSISGHTMREDKWEKKASELRASSRSYSFTLSPRDVLTNTTPSFIFYNRRNQPGRYRQFTETEENRYEQIWDYHRTKTHSAPG